MSIRYSRLVSGITDLHLKEDGFQTGSKRYARLTVWVENDFAGALIVPAEYSRRLAMLFRSDTLYGSADDMRIYWGGVPVKTVVVDNANLPDETILISEDGTILTAGEIRSQAGMGHEEA